jgi:tRNA(fMet)-specific endonuclease VapC
MEIGPIIIDTNSYAAFKDGKPEAVEIIKRVPSIGINPVIMGELLSGFALGNREEKNKEELELFLSSKKVKFFDIDRKTSEYYSAIYRDLRKKGKPIPTNDLWIAATAQQYGLSVFSYDTHFEYVSDLRTISKPEDLTQSNEISD